MKHQLLRAASTCALIAAMSGAAFAQGGGSTGGGSSAPGGGSAPAPSQTERQTPGTGGETVRPKGGGAAESPSQRQQRQPGAAQRGDEGPAARSKQRGDTRDGQRQTPRASGDGKGDERRATGRGQEKDRARTGQEQRGQDRDRSRTGSDQREQDRDRTDRTRAGQDRRESGDRARQGQAERERGKAGSDRPGSAARQDRDGATQLSEQQRTTVRERFSRAGIERNRVTNVNFDIRVGASVPRSVTVHPLPPDVVEIVPQYRSYGYVYVGDEIIIVDPGTYAVVAILSSDGRPARIGGGSRRAFTLAADDRIFLRERIDTSAAVTLGIGGISIGMSVPQGLELRPLPSVVIERVPDLRDHRYFVHDDDIVIVDPDSDEVVAVVED